MTTNHNPSDADDIDYDDELEPGSPFRDGSLHVLDDKCSTCVFRSGNLMDLAPGRLKDMTDSATRDDSFITCHQTLDYNGQYDAEPAVCRGFYDSHSTNPLRIAQRLGIIVFDEQPTKKA